MKKIFAVVVSLMMLLMLSGVAFSAEPAAPAKVKKQHLKKAELTPGVYVSIQKGFTFNQDSEVNDESLVIDDGCSFGIAVGKRIDKSRVRVEGELGYQKNNADKIDGIRDDITGDVKAYTLLVNGYFDFVRGKKIVPYITAGIGAAKVDADVNNFAHEDEIGLAYQVGAGIAYHITDNWHIDLKYRYLDVLDMDLGCMNPEVSTHNVILGLRYRF